MQFPAALDPFRSIKAVLRVVGASPGPLLAWWFGGFAVLVAVYLVFYLPAVLVLATSGAAHGGEPPVWAFVIFAGSLLALYAAMIVGQCLWLIGLHTLLFDVLRTGRCSLARAWGQRRRFGTMLGATLIVVGLALAAYVPLLIGFFGFAALAANGEPPLPLIMIGIILACGWMLVVLYVFLGFVFVNPAAALDECGAFEAVRRSWRAARGHRLALFWLLFVTSIAAMAGLLLFCVGYLFTAGLAMLVPGEAYLALTRGDERARWWITTGVIEEPEGPGATSATS